ncbi:glycoside hydrolase family 32 protein, partial [bacterium LRH843]|nr:glycoside hydrolase family 32 protein [bacterium LRH843]
FGENAFIAVVTQPSEDGGKQEQYLWYSTDEGKTFQSAGDEPVLSNPGIEDFRDPKIIWDDERDKWVMLLAEGSKIGFYESGNLKEWKFTGDF